MGSRPRPFTDPGELIRLARRDRQAALERLESLATEEKVALVCELPPGRRAEILDLLRDPERVIPALPEAELCFTVKAIGLADAGWILEHATPEQVVACVDLDAWGDFVPDRSRLDEWIEAFASAGDEALVRAAKSLDPELMVLWLRSRIECWLRPRDEDWEPPEGALTLEGQFYLRARRPDDDLESVLRLLRLLFQRDYWFYFRMLQGVIWELEAETEEWALRWRTGRLQDLGFPPWEEAMPIYARPRREEIERLPSELGAALAIGGWPLPVWLPRLPGEQEGRYAIFRAAAKLGPEQRRGFFYAFVALANKVAVADRMPLGEAESIPAAIEKAAAVASRGLEVLARRHGLAPEELLRRVPVDRLFRIGWHADPSLDPRGGGS